MFTRQPIFLLALLACSALCVLSNDLYETLELKKGASEGDIKKAFRRLTAQYHPDKNKGNDQAHKRFIEVSRAYEVLSDSEKRQVYDQKGQHGLEEYLQGGVAHHHHHHHRGPNAHAEIPVELSELYNGAVKELSMQKNILCNKCKGTGAKDGNTVKCKTCNGQGVRLQKVQMGIGMTMQMQTTCEQCGGRGTTHAESCPVCRGRKVIPSKKTIFVQVERGMRDGHEIVFARESEQSPDYAPGDVVVRLRQLPNSVFRREGNDLHTDLRISLKDAIMGFSKKIKHLDDHFVDVSSSNIVQPFEIRKIPGQGMPVHHASSQYGDLYVRFIVDLPRKLSSSDRELLTKIFSLNK